MLVCLLGLFALLALLASGHIVDVGGHRSAIESYLNVAERQLAVGEFLHLPENPRPKSVFDPALSIANTQVFKRYPQFAEDVKKIEKELTEYCFDFSKYPEPDFSKKMFYGKSPKHSGFKKKFAEDGYVPQSKK